MTEALVALRDSPLSIDDVVGHVRHSSAGAVCVFLGMVRDWHAGEPVVRLEYEAYAPMAVAEMRRVVQEVEAQVEGVRLALVHRSGTLEIGDIAVVCAASAPHRAEAFRACSLLIELTKARVPIWKREHTGKGTHWVGWGDVSDHDPEPGSST
jgi:molybdopterin synthase catalytic subunit